MNERMRTMLLLLWGLGAVACGREAKQEEASKVSAERASSEAESYVLSETEGLGEVEACSIARPGDCIPRVPSMGTKSITVCGYDLKVPVLAALACQGTVSIIPAGCTVGAAMSAGGTCMVNVLAVAGTCFVAQETIVKAAECCIKGGC